MLRSRVSSGLTYKHWTRLERLGKDKHSSLLHNFLNYCRKKFYDIEPWSNTCRQGCKQTLELSSVMGSSRVGSYPCPQILDVWQKWLTVVNTLVYYNTEYTKAVKRFIIPAPGPFKTLLQPRPGANVIKLFTAVIYSFLGWAPSLTHKH
jgi:hypothetical protein